MTSTSNQATTPIPTSAAPTSRRTFYGASLIYIGCTVILSLIGLVATFPDQNHAASGHITLGQVVFGYGTIMSPPLYFMVVIGLLLWGASAATAWLARTCLVLTVIGVLYTAIVGIGLLADGRPETYSTGKWAVAVVLAAVFLALSAAVIVTGVRWLAQARTIQTAR